MTNATSVSLSSTLPNVVATSLPGSYNVGHASIGRATPPKPPGLISLKHGWGRWQTIASGPTAGTTFRVFILGDGDACSVKPEGNGPSVTVTTMDDVNRKLAEAADANLDGAA